MLGERVEGKRNPRVGLFFWEGYLGVSPSLINALRILGDQGYFVDVFMQHNNSGFPQSPEFSKNIRIHRCPTLGALIRRWLPESIESVEWRPVPPLNSASDGAPFDGLLKQIKTLSYWACWLIDHIVFTAFSFFWIFPCRYLCFIGVDRDGLLTATIAGFLMRVNILCWSLEMRFVGESRHVLQRNIKRLEKYCLRKASNIITQDYCRAEALALENAIDLSKVIIVPNSPSGPPPRITESDYLQRRLSLSPSHSIIVLHLGLIAPSLYSWELAKSTTSWPVECLLVFHERRRRSLQNPYLKQIQEAAPGRISISLDPVSYDDLDKLVSSARIGVVLYRSDYGLNFALAGASGKLGQYLRCGLPVVCLDLPGIGAVVRKYDCGICVTDVEQIGEAIRSILESYERYRLNALRCYMEMYEFGVHFEKVLHVISPVWKDHLRPCAHNPAQTRFSHYS
jgi:glycosyltransferase involved in cell wall biosynthesis